MKQARNFEVLFTNIKINDEFWNNRLKVHREATLKTCMEQCDNTGRVTNFAKAAGLMDGAFEGMYYNDSDVYKVLEGIAYSLMNCRDEELESWADHVIDWIAAAECEDGYINTYFTLTAPEERWKDMEKHEDYCIGHLIEAALAYKAATGKDKLLRTAIRGVHHMMSVMGPNKKHWVVGHEEPELAIFKLYVVTGNEMYMDFAHWLLSERGHGFGSGAIWDKKEWATRYCQDDKPVEKLRNVSGHAVRAMYLYTAMADLAIHKGNKSYIKALDSLWDSVVLRNMYITGGIGSTKDNEGFTRDYDLPNETAYCETCAAIGMVFWNHRMNLLHGESKYADIVEKEMYNGALSGISLSGDKFFYENPLESNGGHHRQNWYGTSCCPTQLARFIPSVGGYLYVISDNGIMINQYISNEGRLELPNNKVILKQETSYPWNGKVKIQVVQEKQEVIPIKLRVPGWCENIKASINSIMIESPVIEKGYLILEKAWNESDVITMEMNIAVRLIHDDIKVEGNKGKVCLSSGPIVYCFEEIDNIDHYEEISIYPESELRLEFNAGLLGGINVVKVINPSGQSFIAVPYYAWDNREPGRMKVWVDYKETL